LPHFVDWNARWQAPFGPKRAMHLSLAEKLIPEVAEKIGPFAYQHNNSTRLVEFPWAFYAAELNSGIKCLEIGGAFSGLQFVLARTGVQVTNVDPFVDYGEDDAYPSDPEAIHERLNKLFGTSVALCRSTLAEAQLASRSFDRAFCISTMEHLPRAEIVRTLRTLRTVLKPGGLFVLTTDLFLDLAPFTDRRRNRWGTNVSIRWLVEQSGMQLVQGDRSELFGYPEFDPYEILGHLDRYLVGRYYPTLAQLLVLRK
jgi:2-polyprenyl-3-methyl-5-hydroxy-6-metoxy-1,4-benzoquinol methylase